MEKMEAREKELKQQETQKKLFEGLKFYLNREVPRESLAFLIRWARDATLKQRNVHGSLKLTFSLLCISVAIQVFWRSGILGQVCVHWWHIRWDRWDHHPSNYWQAQCWQTVYQQVEKCCALRSVWQCFLNTFFFPFFYRGIWFWHRILNPRDRKCVIHVHYPLLQWLLSLEYFLSHPPSPPTPWSCSRKKSSPKEQDCILIIT